MIEIFFPTKDRNSELRKCIESILNYHTDIKVTIANCSNDYEETSKILRDYPVKEVLLNPDPGMNESFNVLISHLSQPLSLWLSDDVVLKRPLDTAIDYLNSNQIDILGIPFIDNIHYTDINWPVDQYGCANWIENGRRVGHFAICKTDILKTITLQRETIDTQIFILFGRNRYEFFESEAFIVHDRYMDETRKNRKI